MNNKQQTTNNKQQTTNNKQQTTNNKHTSFALLSKLIFYCKNILNNLNTAFVFYGIIKVCKNEYKQI